MTLILNGYIDSFARKTKGLLTTQMTVSDLLNYYYINKEVNRDISDQRISKIVNYIDTYDSEVGIYFPSIVLIAEGETPTVNEERNQFVFEKDIKFVVLDGQHRIKALEKYVNKEADKNRLNQILTSTITTQIYFNLNEEQQRELFLDINATSKQVSTSLAFKFDGRNPLNLIIKELLDEENNNLKVNLKVTDKTRITRPSNKSWISISRLNRYLSYLLFNTVQTSRKAEKILEQNYFEVTEFLTQYFLLLIEVFPKDFGNVTKWILGHEAMQNALAVATHEKIVKIEGNHIKFASNWKEIIETLHLIDWSPNSTIFKDQLIQGNGYKSFKDNKHSELLPKLRAEWDENLKIWENEY